MAASGSATRSVDECEMSRSCHSGMPSITGTICARTTRARPQIRSDRTGFFLCGMADEPFWPRPKGSASSRDLRLLTEPDLQGNRLAHGRDQGQLR